MLTHYMITLTYISICFHTNIHAYVHTHTRAHAQGASLLENPEQSAKNHRSSNDQPLKYDSCHACAYTFNLLCISFYLIISVLFFHLLTRNMAHSANSLHSVRL